MVTAFGTSFILEGVLYDCRSLYIPKVTVNIRRPTVGWHSSHGSPRWFDFRNVRILPRKARHSVYTTIISVRASCMLMIAFPSTNDFNQELHLVVVWLPIVAEHSQSCVMSFVFMHPSSPVSNNYLATACCQLHKSFILAKYGRDGCISVASLKPSPPSNIREMLISSNVHSENSNHLSQWHFSEIKPLA